jgi:hypothetical protein
VVRNQTILICIAGIGWGIAVAIIIASALSDEIREDNLYGRLCILSGLVAAVTTSRLWNSRRVVHVPIEVEDAWGLAFRSGVDYGKLQAKGSTPSEPPFSQGWARELTANGNTPPNGRYYRN